jgi:CelD/BcsL family acetyltransferase involved in cellulose biosynthesis
MDVRLSRVEASLVELAYLPAEEPFHRALAPFAPMTTREYSRPLLRKHRAAMSGNLRRRLARQERGLGRLGALTRVALGPQHDVARWIDEFLALEASGWKGRNGSAMACTPVNRRYAEEIFTAAFRRGRLMGCGLDLDGRPIARRLSFTAAEGAYAFKTAYDERYAEFSPGVLLEADNLRQVDADPSLQWMDSFTEDHNLALSRMWSAERGMRHVLVARGAWGRAAAAALPALRWLKGRYVKITQARCAVTDTAGRGAARTVGP